MVKGIKRLAAVALTGLMVAGMLPVSAMAQEAAESNTLKIGTMSDTHYFSESLYGDNEDFTTAMNSDRKMFRESGAILDSALQAMIEDEPDIVLISGDLTKDGEKINHEAVANKLHEAKKALNDKGIDTQFYVINGNHDINNPNALDYSSGQAVETERTSVADFKATYKDFGYGDNTEQYAPNSDRGGSLSYVAHPAEGYTLIVVDSGKYSSDQTASGQNLQETGGVISEDLLNWVTAKAKEAKAAGDVVLVMQHHGVVAHFEEEPNIMADYLVDNYQQVQQAYADAGISYVLTGHMHANDIASYTSPDGNTLYDIETGSLVTYPSPTRRLELTAGTVETGLSSTMKVETKLVESIDYIDPSTGMAIDDLTAYGKQHTLSNDVVKTMIGEQVLAPMIDNAIASGGSKALVGQLLGVTAEEVNPTLIQMVTSMLPTTVEDGLKMSLSGINFSIYYDGSLGQIKVDQYDGGEAVTYSEEEEGVITVPKEDGTVIEIRLPEQMVDRLKTELAVQPQGLFDPISLVINVNTLSDTLLDPLFADIDAQLLANGEWRNVINSFVDAVLNYAVDTEGHTVFDVVNTVYQGHLSGEEAPEAWLTTAIAAIQNDELLTNALYAGIDTVYPVLQEALSAVALDTGNIIQPGNDSVLTSIAHSTVVEMLKNAGDVLGMIDSNTIKGLLPSDLLSEINALAYNVANSMAVDTNYQQDNNTIIEIARTILDVTPGTDAPEDTNTVLDNSTNTGVNDKNMIKTNNVNTGIENKFAATAILCIAVAGGLLIMKRRIQ